MDRITELEIKFQAIMPTPIHSAKASIPEFLPGSTPPRKTKPKITEKTAMVASGLINDQARPSAVPLNSEEIERRAILQVRSMTRLRSFITLLSVDVAYVQSRHLYELSDTRV